MIMKVCFVASDGREFATEADCILHEVEINPEKYKMFHNGIIIYDCDGTVLNGDHHDGLCDDDGFFNAYSIIVFDKEKADSFFTHLSDEFEAVVPQSDPGIYVLDGMEWHRTMRFDGFVKIMNNFLKSF